MRLRQQTRATDTTRALKAAEIAQLERQGNVCGNWSLLAVRDRFDPSRVHHSSFHGRVVLGSFTPSGSHPGPGILASTLVDCELGDDVVIHRCPLISGYLIGAGAYLSASSLVHSGSCTFGNGTRISAGIEPGGREITLLAELDMPTVSAVLGGRGDIAAQSAYEGVAQRYVARCAAGAGGVEDGARVENCRSIRNSWIGPAARISGAELILESTVLSNSDEPTEIGTGAILEHCLVQPGARIDSHAIVQRSLIMEHSTVERQAKVSQSVVGPNVVLGEGEVTASCVGPFTGAHHQSLLIAAFWPAGRGVLGAGSNVGSNHTSRVPDQEIWPGEGMFFGLDSVIKFPADYSRAPYSVIASGVTTLPQRVSFPFSLIVETQQHLPGVSPAFNRLIPAWSLRHNLYALERNQIKYRRRNNARRHQFDFSYLRDDIVAMMGEAVQRLEAVGQPAPHYLPGTIEGIGKNVVLEQDRIDAIETYRWFIDYAGCLALERGLLRRLIGKRRPVCEEDRSARGQLHQLRDMIEALHQSVRASRERDRERGLRIIDDYSCTHPELDDDDVVQHVAAQVLQLRTEIDELLRHLGGTD